MDLLSFVLGAIVGGLITYGWMRLQPKPASSPLATSETLAPPPPDVPSAVDTSEDKALDLDAQRLAAAARIRDQRAASRALREAQRLAAEEDTRMQAQRLALEESSRIEAQRLVTEERVRQEAQRLAAEATAQAEAQRLAAEEAVVAVAPAPVEPAVVAKPPSETLVMIVDDSKVGRIKTNRVLLAHAFQVQMAVDGCDAVNKIAERMPDMVITDVEMPEMDGFELTLHIRQDPATAHLPVIIISGNNDEYAARANEVGADFMLGKPYTDSDLIGHVQRLLQSGH